MKRFLPLALFALLALLLGIGLVIADRKEEIPSPLIGRSVPEFELPVLGQSGQRIHTTDLIGEPFLLNVWGSWCPECRVEHPVITEVAESGRIKVVGLNWKDAPDNARRWLAQFGDPYSLNLADEPGDVAIDFGVYGAPETFLVDARGQIVAKRIGAVTPEWLEQHLPLALNPEPSARSVAE